MKVCGEHKESKISGYDSFLTSMGQAARISIDSDAVLNSQGVYSVHFVYYFLCIIVLLKLLEAVSVTC